MICKQRKIYFKWFGENLGQWSWCYRHLKIEGDKTRTLKLIMHIGNKILRTYLVGRHPYKLIQFEKNLNFYEKIVSL